MSGGQVEALKVALNEVSDERGVPLDEDLVAAMLANLRGDERAAQVYAFRYVLRSGTVARFGTMSASSRELIEADVAGRLTAHYEERGVTGGRRVNVKTVAYSRLASE